MRLTRPLVAFALAGSVLVAGQASAAAKTCNILTDSSGDANDPLGTGLHVLPAPFNNANLDIVGGDFGATTTALTGVLKLAKAPSLDPQSPQGDFFYVLFSPSSAANPLYLVAHSDSSGAMTYGAGAITTTADGLQQYTDNAAVKVKGKVTGSTIAMTVTTAALKPMASVKPGAKITAVSGKSSGGLIVTGDVGLLFGGDESDEALRPVVVGAKSCVVPVK